MRLEDFDMRIKPFETETNRRNENFKIMADQSIDGNGTEPPTGSANERSQKILLLIAL
jgi:hypothetical protein